jgi:hypothetical protein
MRPIRPLFASLLLAAAASACAPPGPYPSLAPRPIEKALADSDEAPPPPPLPDDAALPARMQALIDEARRGESDFAAALPSARAAAGKAGAEGSDSWIEAQQALSRVEAARAVTVGALADLDALILEQARDKGASDADLERMRVATAAVQEVADRQQAEIARLQGRVGD